MNRIGIESLSKLSTRLALVACLAAVPTITYAGDQPAELASDGQAVFVTLGTNGGPLAQADRTEPSNLLKAGSSYSLVDVGDGFTSRLAAVNVSLRDIDNVFISHLHFDHTGGLMAALGLRFQLNAGKPLQVYGPPGIEETVAGILKGMKPAMEAAYGVPGEESIPTDELVQVHEIEDGDVVKLDEFTLKVAKNTHYSFIDGSPEDRKYQSLSFRFETKDRVIVYTGDTGPSANVVKLANGADLLVTELIDLDEALGRLKKPGSAAAAAKQEQIKEHFLAHHLTTSEIAKMAREANVKEVVTTHLVGGLTISEKNTEKWKEEISEGYDGRVFIAKDLDRF